jgi:bla regulator protein BlaR1
VIGDVPPSTPHGRDGVTQDLATFLGEIDSHVTLVEQMEGTMNDRGLPGNLILTATCACLLLAILGPSFVRAQSSATEAWEKAAGGKMSFEVASVKQGEPGRGYRSNFPLTLGSNFASVGNLMSVDVPLRTLIGFAFKFSVGQTHFFMPGLPGWVDSESFDVEARAPSATASKDQFRLMVQSLLANRFKLATHEETRQLPIYELALTKPGRTGPQLRPHVDDATCGAQGRPDAPPALAEFSPFPCGAILIGPSQALGRSGVAGRVRGGGRDIDLNYVAAFLSGTAFQGATPDRPVVNQTGMAGNYDFWVEFVPEASPNGAQPDANGPSFPEALGDQLGLKLIAKTGPVDVLVVDHIEEPTPN